VRIISVTRPGNFGRYGSGFTLLEVMVAMAIIAIALTAVLGSQSQSVSLAGEARFNTTAALLAQMKMAEIETEKPDEFNSGSGDFGEDFPGYSWELTISDTDLETSQNVSARFKRIDLKVFWGEDEFYEYNLRLYRFVPRGG
jgi:general secretion pathway protein I